MSRIGKLPINIPEKVEVTLDGTNVTVKGPKGTLVNQFAPVVKITQLENSIEVKPTDSSRLSRAMHGTARSIINGMVQGVTEGFSKSLQIIGVGFRATVQGNLIDLSLGYSHDIKHPIPDGVTVTVEDGVKIKVEGIDKQVVGQLAAQIKSYYPAEPYKGKGVRIVGQYVRRKEGKKTA
jgi:large subunit ribosomal protein L6